MIAVKQLTKSYGSLSVLQGADFTFPDKGLVCLLGASGCGKSTLLNILAGFDRDYRGEVQVFGKSITQMSEQELCGYRRDYIGFIFQNYCLLPGYSVMENILLPCKLHEMDAEEQVRRAKNLLERLGMADKADEKIENLSGGQKQRVAIARALIKNPQIILADEPTGALDRKNSIEIMQILKEIAGDRLVVVITHDQKLCEYADEVISIADRKIVSDGDHERNAEKHEKPQILPPAVPSAFNRSVRNLKVHFVRCLAVALSVALGVLGFLISISASNVMKQSIFAFKDKNIAFNNGYIAYSDGMDQVYQQLKADDRVENVYYQYLLQDISLNLDGHKVELAEKYAQPMATQAMSYGTMPRRSYGEIALSPSLAKKFADQINTLIGKQIVLVYRNTEYLLTVSGIFNAEYDDFFLSSDLEQGLYDHMGSEEPLSITFDVIDFANIVPITQMLSEQGVVSKTAADEVSSLQNTFRNIQTLFAVVSAVVFGISVFISTILLIKLQNARFKELGLMSALGFSNSTIHRMIAYENGMLSCMAAGFNIVFVLLSVWICRMMDISFSVSLLQTVCSVVATGVLLVGISFLASYNILHTDPAVALRK